MGPELIEDRYDELPPAGHEVSAAWLLAAVVVTLLLTVAAPLLGA